jgi:DUF1365 family protein
MDRHGTREAELRSGLYRGSVRHLRTGPRPHRFRVPLHYLYLDLDELETIFARRLLWSHEAPNLVSFRRRDYHGDPDVPLDQAVRRSVAAEIGREVVGPIRMLTHLRHFGFVFNPVTFYYCYAADGETLEAVLAEITNTPWGERHAYALDLVAAPVESHATRSGAATEPVATRIPRRHRAFRKAFHVSPFLDMDHEYDWGFSDPGEHLSVRMRNFREGKLLFEAGLELKREPITGRALAAALLRNPVIPLFGLTVIYWQAVRLWWKRTPFFPHPRKRTAEAAAPGPVDPIPETRSRSAGGPLR